MSKLPGVSLSHINESLNQINETLSQITLSLNQITTSIKKASKLQLHDHLEPEDDTSGNIEYKIHILEMESKRFHRLATQMKWRVSEGKGNCFYYIGVTDDGRPVGISRKYMEKSIKNIEMIAKYLLYSHEIVYYKKGLGGGFCAKVFITDENSSASCF